MVEALISVRRARPDDAGEIAAAHDAAWREAYRGLIPGRELERMVTRRGPDWWRMAIRRGTRLMVLDFDESVAGYVTFGRSRWPALPYAGEIFELYLAPEFAGIGFGRRLFSTARRELAALGLGSTVVWALAQNERAVGFYRHMGGRDVGSGQERFGAELRERVAFGFT
ncbi:MAG: GNAT family N-acetyltransferase [Rhodoblastus sp.]|nr:MAG: GNAT family N-acetyltransferase [Rhodoblastus sp.]